MSGTPEGRKRVRHFDEPGHVHELTFSCYGRRPLLTNDVWRTMLARAIDAGIGRHAFRLFAFVFMPEHVHLLVYPEGRDATISALLKAIKQPFSNRVRQRLETENDPLLKQLTVRERPGKNAFRFWQEGGGYDRNLTAVASVESAIEYIHMNPVRRGLVTEASQWRWSSSRFYATDRRDTDAELPRISPLPAKWWDSQSLEHG